MNIHIMITQRAVWHMVSRFQTSQHECGEIKRQRTAGGKNSYVKILDKLREHRQHKKHLCFGETCLVCSGSQTLTHLLYPLSSITRLCLGLLLASG